MITPSSSSTHGLIHALKLTQQGSASAVELTADGDSTCLHFDAADPETSQWLLSAGGLNMVAASALTTEETRPRVLRRGDNLVLTLRGVNRLPGAEAEDMVSLRIWTNGSRLISARLRPLQSTDRLVDELLSGEGANTIPGLLVDWVEYVVDGMSDSIASLELDVAAAEAAIGDADPTSTRQSIVVLRKRALQFRRYMAPQREALSRLSTETPTWLDEYHRVRLRDIADRLMRYIEDLDQIRDRAILAQEELAARLADEMNHKTYVFTIVAVLFLPLGFLTGLLGVNVAGVPGVDEPQAFNYLIASCAAMMLALLAYFKWQRWM